MKKLTLFLIALLTSLGLYAQEVSVTGTVVNNSDGEPLIGAIITVKGTSKGASTDVDGKFTLQAPVGSTLVISYLGYTPQEVKVKAGGGNLDIHLIEDSQILDDLVVVGYGVQKKSVVTAAISKVGEETLEQTLPVNVADSHENKFNTISKNNHR